MFQLEVFNKMYHFIYSIQNFTSFIRYLHGTCSYLKQKYQKKKKKGGGGGVWQQNSQINPQLSSLT